MAFEAEQRDLDENAAEKLSYVYFPAMEISVLTRHWPSIAADQEQSAIAYLNSLGTTKVNPIASRKRYPGTFRVVRNSSASERAGKAQQGIIQILTTGDFSLSEFLVSNDCDFEVYRTYYIAVGTLPVVPANSMGTTYEAGPVGFDRDTNTYSTFIDRRVRKARSKTYISAEDASLSTESVQDLGATSVDVLTQETGKIKRRQVVMNSDCTFKIDTEAQTPKDQTGTTVQESPSVRVDETLHTEASSPPAEPTEETGKIKTTSSLPTDAGNHRTTQRVEVPKDQVRTSAEDSAARSVTEVEHTESSLPLDAPTSTQGSIKKNSNTPTAAGNTKTTARVEVPKDQTGTTVQESPSVRVDETLHTEASSPPAEPTEETGKIKTTSSLPTEAGNHRTTQRVEVPKDQTGTTYEESPAESVQETIHTEAASDPSVPTEETGKIKITSSLPTAAGNRKTAERVETPKDQTRVSGSVDRFESMVVTEHTENPAPELATPQTGKLVVVANDATRAGNSRTRKAVYTPIAYSSGWQTYTDSDGVHYWIAFRNQPDLPDLSAYASKNITPSIQPNNYGLFDGLIRVDPAGGGGLSGDAFTTGTAEYSYVNSIGKTVRVYMKYTTSLSIGETFVNVGAASGYTRRGSDPDGGVVTGIHPMGKGRVCAIRVDVQDS